MTLVGESFKHLCILGVHLDMVRVFGIRLLALQILVSSSLLCQNAIATGIETPVHSPDDSAKHPSAIHHHRRHMTDKKSHAPEVSHSITIKAKPAQVWEAIQHQRESEEHRKLISYNGKEATLYETFASLPIVGAANCTYVENETQQYERIDYALLKSDHFHVFEGSWTISPGKDENSSTVVLTNAIDPGIRVPFWQDITKMAASKAVKRRLDAVCAYAEQLNKIANR